MKKIIAFILMFVVLASCHTDYSVGRPSDQAFLIELMPRLSAKVNINLFPEIYAGRSFKGNEHIIIYVTEVTPQLEQAISNVGYPENIKIQVVEFSLLEIQAVHDEIIEKITEQEDELYAVISMGINVKENRLVIRVPNLKNYDIDQLHNKFSDSPVIRFENLAD
ncbi:MAG: hypothetical protein FWF59_02480 [Turicibacter sp.]|nr:hypothetical protein [Turicibacter sp.]